MEQKKVLTREEILKRTKKYNDAFRAKHQENLKQKVACSVCNHCYTYYTKSKHMKTKKHLKALNKPVENDENVQEN